jgi:hypothetical protein
MGVQQDVRHRLPHVHRNEHLAAEALGIGIERQLQRVVRRSHLLGQQTGRLVEVEARLCRHVACPCAQGQREGQGVANGHERRPSRQGLDFIRCFTAPPGPRPAGAPDASFIDTEGNCNSMLQPSMDAAG